MWITAIPHFARARGSKYVGKVGKKEKGVKKYKVFLSHSGLRIASFSPPAAFPTFAYMHYSPFPTHTHTLEKKKPYSAEGRERAPNAGKRQKSAAGILRGMYGRRNGRGEGKTFFPL